VATVHFILAEDRAQSRLLKRIFAEKGSWLHLVIGTWTELAEMLKGIFLIGEGDDLWGERLADACTEVTDAFWADSLMVAASETLTCIDGELRRLILAAGPSGNLQDIKVEALSGRGARHLADLCTLHRSMGEVLPADLNLIQRLLGADPQVRLKNVVVYPFMLRTDPDPWRQALLQWANGISGKEPDTHIQNILASVNAEGDSGEKSALVHMAARLFVGGADRVSLDDSLQWLAVRDPLQEVEVVAGMIQQALRNHKNLGYADFALLVPADGNYALHLQTVFSRTGIPLSGLDTGISQRDVGAEVIFYFLLSMRKPAPVMALAAFLTSPLLPWGYATGYSLAQRVMDGRFDFPAPQGASAGARQLLDSLREGAENADELRRALDFLVGCLKVDKEVEVFRLKALELWQSIVSTLPSKGQIPWEKLLQVCSPACRRPEQALQFYREGVAVFSDSEEPWRQVRQLWVLGFSGGRYPAGVGTSPVFCEADLAALRDGSGLALELPADIVTRRRQLFRRQLAAATNKAHFLIPRRNECGEPLQDAGALTFMARLFGGVTEGSDLVRELERVANRAACKGLALASECAPDKIRERKIADLNLRRNLLHMLTRSDGSIYPLSPSSLATLMVSPLAWLLSRMGLEPKEWCPESLDVATKGTLAHRVFEKLFSPGKDIPLESDISERVPTLSLQAIREVAPFLMAAAWRVERAHLQREIERAAIRWSAFLQQSGGKVLGNEMWLDGKLDDLPIHGSADSVVGLPDGRIFVVDFKKSKSHKRRAQMEKGYDSQASLYRLMLQTGDAKNRYDGLGQALQRGDEIGVLYYLMNDQVALSDTAGWLAGDIPGAYELGAGVSTAAMTLIHERLRQVKHGEVRLNVEGDEKWFDKNAGIKIYALDNSPLLRMFMHPGEVLP
jgi:RecB family exonuclease